MTTVAKRQNKREYKKRIRSMISIECKHIKSITPCVDCGKIYHYAAMQFDHITPRCVAVKSRQTNRAETWSQFKRELKLVEVRCANCHAIRTHNQRKSGWFNKKLLGKEIPQLQLFDFRQDRVF